MSPPDTHAPDILACPTPERQRTARGPTGLLSIVVPCHNEEAVVAATHDRLVAAVAATGMALEVVYVDDGSRDATLARLEEIAARDSRAVVVELSRNFGQQAAMSAGLAQLRCAETEKYAHVTFFLNGGVEAPKAGEERVQALNHDYAISRQRLLAATDLSRPMTPCVSRSSTRMVAERS